MEVHVNNEERKEEKHDHKIEGEKKKSDSKGEISIPVRAKSDDRKKQAHIPASSTCKCGIF